MESCIEAIMKRRSIRDYTDAEISRNHIDTILEAAMAAPSAADRRPWSFLVMEDRDLLRELAEIQGGYSPMKRTPMAVLVCGEPSKGFKDFWEQDCSAAVQNILLAAHGVGLGAVWMGVHPDASFSETVSRRLGLPAGVVPFAIVGIGHPAPGSYEAPRRERTPEPVYWGTWGNKG